MDPEERGNQNSSLLRMETCADQTDHIEQRGEEEEEEIVTRRQLQRRSKLWQVCGRRLPRCEIVFFCQIVLIYIVVLTSLVNLTLKNGPINLWIALLGSCLGYLLPHPSMDNLPFMKK